jgi:hypothetical protein
MPDDQQVTELSPEGRARLVAQRQVIERYLAPQSKAHYETSAGKLGLLRALLEQRIFTAAQTCELQCMGIILGDVFVQEMQMV